MKRLMYALSVVLVTAMLFPMGSMGASIPSKKSVPQVPITYPGDTDKTILRRVQWIEEAKKEGNVVWWGILRQPEAEGLIAEFNKTYPFKSGFLGWFLGRTNSPQGGGGFYQRPSSGGYPTGRWPLQSSQVESYAHDRKIHRPDPGDRKDE